jgi:hypothetical protein
MSIQQDFQSKVFKKYGSEYSVVGTYINSRTRIGIKHNACEKIWNALPATFLAKTNPRTCPNCSTSHNRKLTNEDFIKEVKALVGDEYTPIEEYKNRATKIMMRHNACTHVWKVTPNQFVFSMTRCPKCFKGGFNRKLSEDEFRLRVFINAGEEYLLLGAFINTNQKIKTKHLTCGYEWNAYPCQLMKPKGSRCPQCSGKKLKTDKWFRNEIFSQVGVEYQVIGKYVNAKSKVKLKHNVCGHQWDVLPRKFVGCEKTRCPKCFKPEKKTHEKFIREVFLAVGKEYMVMSNYKSNRHQVKMKHNNCGCEWKLFPSNFLHITNPTRCPKCNESKGESRIDDYLNNHGIISKRQQKFADCRHVRPLPFDFFVYNPDQSVALIIEYQGEQHYRMVEHMGGAKGYEDRKRNDNIKKEFCQKIKIPLLEIKYTEFEDIERILQKKLSSLGLLKVNNLKLAA